MNERISRDDVAHVARLACLSLTDDELDSFTSQLADILEHAADLDALELEEIQPTAHPLPLANVLRDDEPGAAADREAFLASAPQVENNQFKVPPALGDPS
jgi:aspartyl-tRNA(Asn)/glutamyl-tRNA(Gln) amidotransferase subunit C